MHLAHQIIYNNFMLLLWCLIFWKLAVTVHSFVNILEHFSFCVSQKKEKLNIWNGMRVSKCFTLWREQTRFSFHSSVAELHCTGAPRRNGNGREDQSPGQAFSLNGPKKLQSHLAQAHTHRQSGSHKNTWGLPPTHQTHPYIHTQQTKYQHSPNASKYTLILCQHFHTHA